MIKNIILDLGGVILDIDYHLTVKAFFDLGIEKADELYSQQSQTVLFDKLEKGQISDEEFFSEMRRLSGKDISDEQIKYAWNALLIGLPEKNVDILKELKGKYRLFLLSNTNVIHERAYRQMIITQCGSFVFDDLFEKMYLSHQIGMRKPDAEIFEYVVKENDLNKSETLFIDDSIQHIMGADKVGLNVWFFEKGCSLADLNIAIR